MGSGRVEIWAGLECTINRVGDQWFDQSVKNGHLNRESDLDLFASLGIKKIRYPVLWEAAQSDREDGQFDFARARPRLHRLRDLGIEPIVGLLHHGSGPRTTSLIDPNFPTKLARYARAVAEEFPFVEDYTPVNEPLTTARFSGLYGVWYPHGEDNPTMLRCLLNQCKGTVLAMHEIRRVNPRARLVQTDDLGRAQGTEVMAERVAFENDRRWLGFDLLFGRVDRNHKLWSWILENGVTEQELDWFLENPCPPDVIGINHYPNSNRFIDHRIELYPPHFRSLKKGRPSTDGTPRADLSVPQALELYPDDPLYKFISPEDLLREVCLRYDADVAVTEVHIDGGREAQLRWINEIHQGACNLKSEGFRVKAITIWSLLGNYDWNCLCAECRFYYEPGVFDVRCSQPRPTAIAHMTEALATQGEYNHPVLSKTGRWRKYQPTRLPARPLLVAGASALGGAFGRTAHSRNLDYQMIPRNLLDISRADLVREALEAYRPWAVINSSGFGIDDSEKEPEKAYRENVVGNEVLAIECERLHIPFLTFSSDLVFDGSKATLNRGPYVESDQPSPLSVYGRTKAEMEARVLAAHGGTLVVRASPIFGPWDENTFVLRALRRIAAGEEAVAPEDLICSYAYGPDLVANCIDLLIDGTDGLIHLSNAGEISWVDLIRSIALKFSLNPELIRGAKSSEMPFAAKRPSYSALVSNRLKIMTNLDEALDRCQRDIQKEMILY